MPRDRFGREINYLRLSVTDHCNLRCVYCMPLRGLSFIPSPELLSAAEIETVVRAAVSVGFRKFRLTGGEPTLRPDIVEITRRIGAVEGVEDLAMTSNAVIFGFNVRADNAARKLIESEGLDLRYYNVIYDLIDDVKQGLSGMLAPEMREEIVGIAEVRDVFSSPKFGQIAGCMVVEGAVYRSKPIRVLRDNVVIYQGELESLRRHKDDVNEVRAGTECGIGVKNYTDVKVGDQIEVYEVKEIARTL